MSDNLCLIPFVRNGVIINISKTESMNLNFKKFSNPEIIWELIFNGVSIFGGIKENLVPNAAILVTLLAVVSFILVNFCLAVSVPICPFEFQVCLIEC